MGIDGGAGSPDGSGGSGGSGIIIDAGQDVGVIIPPDGSSSVPSGSGGEGGACDSPPRRACGDLQGYLDQVGGAGAPSDFGAGDLTLLVIFDKSGSMAAPWDLRDKWQAASDAMIAGMAPYLDNLTIGAILFPKPDECQVAPFDAAEQIGFVSGRQFVSEWVESACLNQPNGGTPMELAFNVADGAIRQASELGLLEERFRVLLVTDGEPNCESVPERLPMMAERWRAELGVETWVIGLPGSEQAAALLDSIAASGGTEKHTPAADPCEFQNAVGAVAQ